MTLNAKIGGFTDFLAIFACESLSFTRWRLAADATRVADVYYGPDWPSPNDMRFSKL